MHSSPRAPRVPASGGPQTDPAARNLLALIGPRCAGKSSVGRELARLTGLECWDSDDEIALAQGAAAAEELVAREGWPAFRRLEARLIEQRLAAGGAGVLATGGGAVEFALTRSRLNERAWCVWLDAPADVLAARMRADPRPRPALWGADAVEEIARVLEVRRELYAACAHARFDTGGLGVDELARQIADRWSFAARCGPRSASGRRRGA